MSATRASVYVSVTVLLAVGGFVLAGSRWQSDAQLHTVFEVGACLIALFAAAIAFVRYYTRPTNTFLFIATAFLCTAFLDAYHAVITSGHVAERFPSGLVSLVAWSWLASRVFLSVTLWLSYLSWRREDKVGIGGRWKPATIYAVAITLMLASFLFFAFINLPRAYFPELPTGRPQELIPAAFFGLALYGYLRKGRWRDDPFEHGLVLSLIFSLFAQVGYMLWARQNYDAMFDAAHLLKDVSYVAVAIGLLSEAFFVYRRDQEAALEFRRINARLSREIAERRRAESEREELERQLLQAQKLEAVGELAGGIAHDFNNVLTAIAGYTQLGLRRLDEDEPLANDLRNVLECSNRGAALVQQLVAFSRRQALESSVLELNPLVDNAVGLVERLIGEEIELEVDLGSDIRPINADPNQIEQVLVNLVVNARDAMPDGGKLAISTGVAELDEAAALRLGLEHCGSYAMLSVCDSGTGMDEETLARVFEPFFTTKEVGKGTGLGLATAYGIVKQHGGGIAVDTAPREGTTFRIYLPYAADGAVVENPAPEADHDEAAGGEETVLLVEDEDMVRDVAVRFLEDHGYAVLTAAHPVEAERIYAQRHEEIDLLVTDVVMPGFNGRELYFRLLLRDPRLKVLFMSGYADQALGADDAASLGEFFIQKPFSPDDLLVRVRQILDD